MQIPVFDVAPLQSGGCFNMQVETLVFISICAVQPHAGLSGKSALSSRPPPDDRWVRGQNEAGPAHALRRWMPFSTATSTCISGRAPPTRARACRPRPRSTRASSTRSTPTPPPPVRPLFRPPAVLQKLHLSQRETHNRWAMLSYPNSYLALGIYAILSPEWSGQDSWSCGADFTGRTGHQPPA